jgi:transcriptional regulator of acetoin/glycerol metabolism
MLRFHDGNVAATAKAVGMDRTALHRKMRHLGLKR